MLTLRARAPQQTMSPPHCTATHAVEEPHANHTERADLTTTKRQRMTIPPTRRATVCSHGGIELLRIIPALVVPVILIRVSTLGNITAITTKSMLQNGRERELSPVGQQLTPSTNAPGEDRHADSGRVTSRSGHQRKYIEEEEDTEDEHVQGMRAYNHHDPRGREGGGDSSERSPSSCP